MAKKKITQLDPATSVNSDALFPLSQEDNNEDKTFKGTIEQLGDYINKSQDFNTLNTTSKKIVGAINEVLADANKDIISAITTPAPIMTFNDGGDNIPINALSVEVKAVQASGTPTPSSPLAITGWSQAQISVSDGVTPHTVVIPFGDTYYGGTLDVVNGILTVTHGYIEYDGSSDETWNYSENSSGKKRVYIPVVGCKPSTSNVIANWLVYDSRGSGYPNVDTMQTNGNATPSLLIGVDDSITQASDWTSYLSMHTLQIVFELNTPVIINLTPEQIATLSGVNNIYADCGDIQELEYFNENADDLAKLIRAMT